MNLSHFYLVVLLCLLTVAGKTEEKRNAWCKSISSSDDLLKCVLVSHPDVKVQEAQVKEDEEAVNFARQSPNPELDLQGVNNNVGGISGELAVLHTIEIGGKRDSRVNVARAQINGSKSRLLKVQETVAVQTVLNIYRLRQIERELESVKESLETFQRIRKRYNQIGRLNPEQQVSVSVFKMAEEDNKLIVNTLISERERILSTFKVILGENFNLQKIVLPPIKKSWPKISLDKVRGADSLIALSSLATAEAKSELAKSAAWPDLSIGPRVEVDTGRAGETRVGIALSMPLPFYNTNNGGRAKAKLHVQKIRLNEMLNRRNLESRVRFLLADYNRSSKVVSRSLVETNIGSKHVELHKLIRRGVVSAPLVIEMHREISEYYKNLHAQELRAIECLWTLYALRGTILKENLL